jgi:N-acetylglucosamine-6-phosphate deacetylase
MHPGEYDLHIGGKVVMTPEGKLHLAENLKILAGSAQMLRWGIGHLAKRGLCSLATAWDMSSVRPRL